MPSMMTNKRTNKMPKYSTNMDMLTKYPIETIMNKRVICDLMKYIMFKPYDLVKTNNCSLQYISEYITATHTHVCLRP